MVSSKQFLHEEDLFLAELSGHIKLLPQEGLHLYHKEVLEWRQQHQLTDVAYQ